MRLAGTEDEATNGNGQGDKYNKRFDPQSQHVEFLQVDLLCQSCFPCKKVTKSEVYRREANQD